MAKTALGGLEKCPVCDGDFNPLDPSTRPPACSKECWDIWIKFVNHKGQPCWIVDCLEVNCGVRTPGYCNECEIFKIEQTKGKRKEERRDESY